MIRGYDWGLFPTDATYSVFVFYIWFSLLCIAKKDLLVVKKDLLVDLITFKKTPKKMITHIKKMTKKTDEETDEETKKEVPLVNYIMFHFFLFAVSFTTSVYNLSRLMGTICFPLVMLLTLTIVYVFPYMLAKEQT